MAIFNKIKNKRSAAVRGGGAPGALDPLVGFVSNEIKPKRNNLLLSILCIYTCFINCFLTEIQKDVFDEIISLHKTFTQTCKLLFFKYMFTF